MSLQSHLESRGNTSTELERPEDPALKSLLSNLQPSQFDATIRDLKRIERILSDDDFQDILAILRSPKKLFQHIKQFEHFEAQMMKKGQKMEQKRGAIRKLNEEKSGLGRQMGKVRREMESVRVRIQAELEANFKAKFLVINS